MKRVTLKDVAKKAGVDASTVSLVINNNSRIPEKTRQKVLKVIKFLNYRPNSAARILASGKTNNIAVVCISFTAWYEMTLLKGIEKMMEETNYSMSQYPTAANPDREEEFFGEVLNGGRADAVIGISMLPGKKVLDGFKKNKIPFVSVGEMLNGFTNLLMNDFNGGYMAAEHLIKNKRKKTGLIIGKQHKGMGARDITERLRGFRKAFADYHAEFDERRVVVTDKYTIAAGEEKFNELMNLNGGIDGIFCAAGDIVAIGAMKEAKRKGVSVPGDIALVGYDDTEMSRGVAPELTTVRQPVLRIGEEAFKAVEKLLKGEKAEDIIFEPEFIIRESA